MFYRNPRNESHPLDAAIANLINEIENALIEDEPRDNAVQSLKTLMELRNNDKIVERKVTVSPDALVTAGAYLAGIVMILGFEKANVITSKALGTLPRPKI